MKRHPKITSEEFIDFSPETKALAAEHLPFFSSKEFMDLLEDMLDGKDCTDKIYDTYAKLKTSFCTYRKEEPSFKRASVKMSSFEFGCCRNRAKAMKNLVSEIANANDNFKTYLFNTIWSHIRILVESELKLAK